MFLCMYLLNRNFSELFRDQSGSKPNGLAATLSFRMRMKSFSFVNYYRKIHKNGQLRRYYSTEVTKGKSNVDKIRNIGILAHIDAGKTTTTERMLFYSGTIRSMGEVHHGNTVTDYMEQERQRGITITSAAVSFPWRDHQINLIDTPGHIDFTMEVEQSLAVLDGAVVVLDGSAGVEAQTLTVWRQAEGYKVPRLIYLNKMDRSDAFEDVCMRSVIERLEITPLLLHRCVRHQDRLIGLIDLVTLEEVIWTQGRGQKFTKRRLTEKEDGAVWEKSMESHRNIVDALSGLDDELADIIIQKDSLDDLEAPDIDKAIKNCTINMTAFPVLCGSSYKNIGVQTLMDAVTSYLPSPNQGNELYSVFGSDLVARAFKVQHDSQRGVLTFLRLHGGQLDKGQRLYSLGQNKSEQSGALYVALADEFKQVERVTAGNIAVVSGLKTTMTGDLVTSTQAAANRAKTRLSALLTDRKKIEQLALPSALQRLTDDITPSDAADVLLGIGTTIPDPVFMCSIEPPSAGQLSALETALEELRREDPSLRVTNDEEAGQLILAGMGELHLEIIKERIIREYKIDVELGPLQIAYREALEGEARRVADIERRIGGSKHAVKVELSARPKTGEKTFRLDKSPEAAANLAHLHPRVLKAVELGVDTALLRGPTIGCKMIDVEVTLHWLEVARGTSDSVVSAAVAQCLRKVFEEAGTTLLEPVMSVSVVCPESHSARVAADLARRRAAVSAVRAQRGDKVIECTAPLSQLVGYASALRALSSGLAAFTMQYRAHQEVPAPDRQRAIEEATGCY